MLQSARHQGYISEQVFFSVHQDLRLQGTWHSILSCQSSAGQIPGKRTLLKVDEQPLKITQQKKESVRKLETWQSIVLLLSNKFKAHMSYVQK